MEHDASAALVKDGEILVAISQERLTKIKKDHKFKPDHLINYVLDATGYSITFTPTSATNKIEVKFNAGYALSANTKSFRFMLDGVAKGGSDLLIGEINPTMIEHFTNLSATSHTIKLQMLSVGGGSATLAGSASGYIADLSILEIY